MSLNRYLRRRVRLSATRLSVRQLVRASFTLFSLLLMLLGASPLALLGPVRPAFAQATTGTVNVKVYIDAGRDGRDAGGAETGLGNILISGYTADGLSEFSGSTSATAGSALGTASFNAPYGEYLIEAQIPSNLNYVVSVPGTDFTNPGLVFRVNINQPTINLSIGVRPTSGGIDTTVTTSERSITTRVWDDLDGDGIQDADEPGISGLTVQLIDGSFNVIRTGTAAPLNTPGFDGVYVFPDAPSGSGYNLLVLNPPANYTRTIPNVDFNQQEQRDSDAIPPNGYVSVSGLRGANTDALDIGYTRGAISGYLFRDVDANGAFEVSAGDTQLNGITVELLNSSTNAVLTTTVTRAQLNSGGINGIYRFTGLAAGSYIVRVPGSMFATGGPLAGAANSPNQPPPNGDQGIPDGIVSTTDGVTIPVTLDFSNIAAGSNVTTTANFGDYQGAVGDLVWYDVNHNGEQDDGPGLGRDGVRLCVDSNSNGICNDGEPSFTTTSDNPIGNPGYYLFDNLPLGSNYRILLDPANFAPGGLLEGYGVHPNTASSLTPGTYYTNTGTLSAASPSNLNIDFALTRSNVGNFVFVDTNGDGIAGIGEPGIPNVTVRLYDAATNTPVMTETTGPGGFYTITNVLARASYAVFDLASAASPFNSYVGNITTTNNVDPAELIPGDFTDLSESLGDTRWRTPVFTPSIGIANNGVDAGFYALTTVDGRTFFDTDGNGADNPPEPAMRGIEVQLRRQVDTSLVMTRTTDTTGVYTFTDVAPGNYVVDFVNPNTTIFSVLTDTTNFSTTGQYNSDPETIVNGAGRTGRVDVTSGTAVSNLDAGFTGRSTVQGVTFIDINADGQQNETPPQPSLQGVTVTLVLNVNLPALVTQITREFTTQSTGVYSFTGLPGAPSNTPGQTSLFNLTFTQPVAVPPWSLTTPDQGDNATDSDGELLNQTLAPNTIEDRDQGYWQAATVTARVFEDEATVDNTWQTGEQGIGNVSVGIDPAAQSTDPTSGRTASSGLITFTVRPGVYTVTVPTAPLGYTASPTNTGTVVVTATSGVAATPADFGYYRGATITGTVYYDVNGNAARDTGEPGLQGITVELGPDVTPATRFTDANGVYTFTGLISATYNLTVTNPDTGNFAFITPTSGLASVTVNFGGNVAQDAGLRGLGGVGGTAFHDQNANGVQDGTEAALGGVTVTLVLDVHIPGTLTTRVISEVTTATGVYSFTGLPGGGTSAYTLTFAPPDTTWFPSTYPTGQVPNQTLNVAENDVHDPGFYQNAIVTARVFNENVTVNNTLDPGEPGIPGVTVGIDPGAQSIDPLGATTGTDGWITFTVRPGVYTVTVPTAPLGYTASPTNTGTVVVTTTSGVMTTTADFGYYRGATITGTVYYDVNQNGTRDTGEPGLQGITVELGPDVTPATRLTDANGVYTFTGLISATYNLTVTNPDTGSFVFTAPTGGTASVVANAGTSVAQDAGLRGNMVVRGYTFQDGNANGLWNDAVDQPLSGATVTLTLALNLGSMLPANPTVTLPISVTDASGYYTFTGLLTGTFDVSFAPPTDTPPWRVTTAEAGGATNEAVNSDSDLTGQTLNATTAPSPQTRDQGYWQAAQVTAHVFDERVQVDNTWQTGEPGIPGVTVGINPADLGGITTGSTGSTDGMITFTVRPGVYTVTVPTAILPNYTASPTNTGTRVVTATSGLTATAGFGYRQVATITGTVFFDRDLDGLKTGEPGLQNVAVELRNSNGTISTTQTSATGAYTFTNLVSDTYTLVFTNPNQLNFAFFNGTGTDSKVVTSGAVPTSTINPVAVTYGATVGAQDAGLIGRSTVGGTTFEDSNANGQSNDPQDRGLPGVTVTLVLDVNIANTLNTQITRTQLTTSTTGISGTYSFASLPGTSIYTLTFTPPVVTPPWQVTFADQGANNIDSDGPAELQNQTLAAGGNDDRDQGYYQNATITARVFNERVGVANNQYMLGDPGLSGVDVDLRTITGTLGVTQTTDPSGLVTFTVRPGVDYALQMDQSDVSPPLVPSPGFTNPLTITGNTLLSGQSSLTDNAGANSFGYYEPVVISGTVFFDRNLDNAKLNEPGVGQVPVELRNASGTVSTTTTLASGAYSFTNLLSDTYTLVFTNPVVGNFAFFNGGNSLVTPDAGGITSTLNLNQVSYGTNPVDRDAGMRGLSSVGGRAFIDANADGDSEAGADLGLDGVTINLTLDVNISGILNTQIKRTAVTPSASQPTGVYTFTGLPGGTTSAYTLTFSPPATTWLPSNYTTGQVVNTAFGVAANDVYDPGFYQNATVTARVFDEQTTINNTFETGDVGLPGVTVGIDTTPAQSLSSDANGLVTFTVKPGMYTLNSTLPTGFTLSPTNTGTIVLTATSGLVTSRDFGYYKPSSIVGTAWFDTNRNGMLDAGEPGMQGVAVTLQSGAGTAVSAAVQTDVTGSYTVSNVLPNGINSAPTDYRLCFSRTSDFTYTLRSGALATDSNSDVNAATGCSDVFTIAGSNKVITTTDAGYLGQYSLGDLVWNDLNNDGLQDANENGLGGAVVTLAITTTGGMINSTNPTVIMTATSTASTALAANYAVTGVPPAAGFRVVSVVPPVGFVPVPTDQGSSDAVDSDPVGMVGGAIPPSVSTLDFGFVGLTTVGDMVWLDLNGNGLYDPGSEPGVPGVQVSLLRGATTVSTTTTLGGAQAGQYAFAGIPAGPYSLHFTAPTGYVFTNDGAGAITTDGDNDARADGSTITFTLIADQQQLSVDAGLRGTSSIGGLVWFDENMNNVRDASETGRIAGVTVTLTLTPTLTPGSSVVMSTTTAANGTYSFANLPPGVAIVSFTKPNGYSPAVANVGDDTLDSDGPVVSIDLAAGAALSTVDMGYRIIGLKVYLPFIAKPLLLPDLTATFQVTPVSLQGYTPAQVAVTVTNQGDAAASNFWVDFYINPAQVPTVNQRWNDICSPTPVPCQGIAWYYPGTLAPGQSVTLVSTATSDTNPNGYLRGASVWSGSFINGTSKLYVYVDSWNRDSTGQIRDPNGAVLERSETNNLAAQDITVTPGTPVTLQQAGLTSDLIDRSSVEQTR